MSGTAAQVEWAERIRDEVSAEFDRVAALFQSICRKEQGATRRHAEDILGILEEKRAEVMSKGQAAYFIRNWREIDGQVRRMILQDPRCHQDESIPAQRL